MGSLKPIVSICVGKSIEIQRVKGSVVPKLKKKKICETPLLTSTHLHVSLAQDYVILIQDYYTVELVFEFKTQSNPFSIFMLLTLKKFEAYCFRLVLGSVPQVIYV